jgi:hypothetical protein
MSDALTAARPAQGLLYRGQVIGFLSMQSRAARAFLISLAIVEQGPGELPSALAAELESATRLLEELLARMEAKTYFRQDDLASATAEANLLSRRWPRLACELRDHVLAAASTALLDPPYPLAERVWRAFDESVASSNLPLFDRGRVQAVIRKAKDPAGIVPFWLRTGLANQNRRAFPDLKLFTRLARHTPLPRLGEKTVWQVEDEATRDGGCAYFQDILKLLASPHAEDQREAEAIEERLRRACIDERWSGSRGDMYSCHRALAALWRDIRHSLRRIKDPPARRRALKPLLKLRSTFIIEDYYPEVKEFILEGLADPEGLVRRAVARFAHDVFLTLREDPALSRDLGEALLRSARLMGPHLPGHAKSVEQALRGFRREPPGAGPGGPDPAPGALSDAGPQPRLLH